MNLNSSQIKEIKRFINSRGFSHIEVEMEILDHVASAVEDKLEKDPKKSIDQAIREVHSGFGVMGFSTMEDEFRKSFSKIFAKEKTTLLYSYLIGSKLPISLLLIGLFYLLGILLIPTLISNGISFKIFFYILGIITGLILIKTGIIGRRKLVKKSFVLSIIAPWSIFAFTIFGQGFGAIAQITFDHYGYFPIGLFSLFSSIIVLYGLLNYHLMKWSFNWTNERYLKYA